MRVTAGGMFTLPSRCMAWDRAMGLKNSKVGWFSFVGGVLDTRLEC